MLTLLSYLARVTVLIGVYYIFKPRLRGQFIRLGADIMWLVYSAGTEQWGLMARLILLAIIALMAIRNWKLAGIKF